MFKLSGIKESNNLIHFLLSSFALYRTLTLLISLSIYIGLSVRPYFNKSNLPFYAAVFLFTPFFYHSINHLI